MELQAFRGEILQDFLSEEVVADGADHATGESELRHMIGEIRRSATDFLTFGQHVPQGFAHSYYYLVFHDDMMLL